VLLETLLPRRKGITLALTSFLLSDLGSHGESKGEDEKGADSIMCLLARWGFRVSLKCFVSRVQRRFFVSQEKGNVVNGGDGV